MILIVIKFKMSYKLLCCAIFLCGIIYLRLRSLDYRAIRFNDYLRTFNKSYGEEEFRRRLVYFEESLEEIYKLNSGKHSTGAVHGHTKFSDWSKKEIANILLQKRGDSSCTNYKQSCKRRFRDLYSRFDHVRSAERKSEHTVISNTKTGYKELPARLDWRKEPGVIGPVDNQKLCNGCWAFGIVGVMEAMCAIQYRSSDELSVQQLLDCSSANNGCNGGNIDYALEFLCSYHYKLTTEDKYPLRLIKEDCRLVAGKRGIKSYEIMCGFEDEAILEKLVHGPVLAVVHPTGWLNYNSGVITRNCFDKDHRMVHVVQIVGYDTSDEYGEDIPYYIVKNSWGTDWGEDGYIRIARNKNLCGITNHNAILEVL